MDETFGRGNKADVRRGRSIFTELVYYIRVRHIVGVVCSFWEGTADRGFAKLCMLLYNIQYAHCGGGHTHHCICMNMSDTSFIHLANSERE